MKLLIAIISLSCLLYCDAIVCYNGLRLESGFLGSFTLNDTRKNMTCPDGYICSRFDVDSTLGDVKTSVTQSSCISLSVCESLTCDGVTQVLLPLAIVNSCQAGCCDSDGCNMKKLPLGSASWKAPLGSAGKLGGKTTMLALLALLTAKALY